MSNADYVIAKAGIFSAIANTTGAIVPMTNLVNITSFRSIGVGDRFVGQAILIDDEIMRITAINPASLHVARGCADTVPAAHADNAIVWFFHRTVTSDGREYFPGETTSVKVLPRTASRTMPIEYSPPQTFTFAGRAAHPYPPGRVIVGASVWYASGFRLTAIAPNLAITWAHRNRLTQADQLVAHEEVSVTPEVGTTYRLRLFTAGNTLVRTISGVTAAALTYTRAEAATDFGLAAISDTGDYPAYAILDTQRDGYASLQNYRIDFVVDTTAIVGNLLLETGYRLLLETGDHINLEN